MEGFQQQTFISRQFFMVESASSLWLTWILLGVCSGENNIFVFFMYTNLTMRPTF